MGDRVEPIHSAGLPAPWQDILDLTYYSGWRKNEILGLTWDEIDEAGGVIRLSPARSKTVVGRILPISHPIAEALARRRARRDPDSPLAFHRDGIPVRRWRTAWRTACQAAGVPTRFLHDCRRTAARNLIRASVPERVTMLLTGHTSRTIFDRDNIINQQELLEAGDLFHDLARNRLDRHPRCTPRDGAALAHLRPPGGGRTSSTSPTTPAGARTRSSASHSIDALFRQTQILEQQMEVELADHAPVLFRRGSTIERVPRDQFATLAAQGTVDLDTTVFDNTLTTVGDVRAGRWETRLGNAWHARAFF